MLTLNKFGQKHKDIVDLSEMMDPEDVYTISLNTAYTIRAEDGPGVGWRKL